ncbi:MAG: SufD family Fe-S cluster assembly protein [Bacteroidaceae bacterium]|jgi:Fe-S cluster assembly protein SufD|nr:SufD family Fe-S cluster assembly protein [Bacteroidaceae bacterium]
MTGLRTWNNDMELIVEKGTVVEKKLQLSDNHHLNINIEQGGHLQLLLEGNYAQLETEVMMGSESILDLCDLDMNPANTSRIHNLRIHQSDNSQAFVQSISLGYGNTTNTTNVIMNGEGAELSLNGLVIANGSQHVDNHTHVTHAVPHCTSHQLYKYVLDEQAQGTYAGLVEVKPGAHHTISEQTNRNLCGSRQARMFAQPQLEIYNDDVRCNHGSSTGQLDESALFYMRQRGIPIHEARLLLMSAFSAEVIDMVRIPTLRERLHELAEQRFRNL